MLPGGRGVLFTITRRDAEGRAEQDRQVAVLDLKSGQTRTLIRPGSQAEYVDTGHLVYTDRGALWAVRFDVGTVNVIGDPVPLTRTGVDAGRGGVHALSPRNLGVRSGDGCQIAVAGMGDPPGR